MDQINPNYLLLVIVNTIIRQCIRGVLKMPIVVTVVGGKCQGEHHRIGDRWEIESVTPHGMCLGAWGAVFPYVMVLDLKGEFSWEDDPDQGRLEQFLNSLEGEVVTIIPNVTPVPATYVDFLLIVEKAG